MNKPFYTSAATQDLEDILRYIAKDKPNAAVAWVRQLESKCLLIATAPEIGEAKPQLGIGVRASVVGRYVIFHRHTNERVEILRVIAGDRDVTEL
ncbi:MAG: type II toxin-antitoxin system RelE/ParE family toxin [Planctomycetaceae bacterium]|nr:type II toxin-antitoxin system RelE/ParE family toxin [Planctomycetales bacterium]MCB9874813.1 type II toxin-antitoxin system RelE/ParE family toxin [Planctomycetaceae bacterium]HRX79764.1 type II toxin-antitoxin system RelE/ParE family toxin [Pirellulaceae bacterium]